MRLTTLEQEIADYFWQNVGEPPKYPCNLERCVSLALPLVIIKLPHLKIYRIESWLQSHGIPMSLDRRSRAVRGCLVAHGGHGLVFIDGTDSENEQRFTLGHEVAHFLIDYWYPRQKAIEQLGQGIIPVLDGLQQPNIEERLRALISHVPLGRHVDILSRHEGDGAMSLETLEIESKADRLALALLAPPTKVLSDVDLSAPDFETRQEHLINALCDHFGLPAMVAEPYAGLLLSSIGKGPDSWLKKFRRNS